MTDCGFLATYDEKVSMFGPLNINKMNKTQTKFNSLIDKIGRRTSQCFNDKPEKHNHKRSYSMGIYAKMHKTDKGFLPSQTITKDKNQKAEKFWKPPTMASTMFQKTTSAKFFRTHQSLAANENIESLKNFVKTPTLQIQNMASPIVAGGST